MGKDECGGRGETRICCVVSEVVSATVSVFMLSAGPAVQVAAGDGFPRALPVQVPQPRVLAEWPHQDHRQQQVQSWTQVPPLQVPDPRWQERPSGLHDHWTPPSAGRGPYPGSGGVQSGEGAAHVAHSAPALQPGLQKSAAVSSEDARALGLPAAPAPALPGLLHVSISSTTVVVVETGGVRSLFNGGCRCCSMGRPKLRRGGVGPGAADYREVPVEAYRRRPPEVSMTGRNYLPGGKGKIPGPDLYYPVFNTKTNAPQYSMRRAFHPCVGVVVLPHDN